MPKGSTGDLPAIGNGPVGTPYYDDPIAGQFPDQQEAINAGSPGNPAGVTAASQTGVSLGAALLNLSIEEAKPQLGGGLSLFARQDRRISRLESDVAALKQTS